MFSSSLILGIGSIDAGNRMLPIADLAGSANWSNAISVTAVLEMASISAEHLGLPAMLLHSSDAGFHCVERVAPPRIEESWALTTLQRCDGPTELSPSAYSSCSHGLQIYESPSRPEKVRPVTWYQSGVDQIYGRTAVTTFKGPSEPGIYKVLKELKDLLFVKFSLLVSDYLIEIHCVLSFPPLGRESHQRGKRPRKAEAPEHAKGRGSIFIGKSIGNGSREFSGCEGPNKRKN
jgi:hypothetical protein